MTLAHRRNADFAIRAIPLDVDVYSTGLVAADRLALERVTRMRDAFVAGYDFIATNPSSGYGVQALVPDISERHIRANWELFEPYAFDGPPPGSMDADRWQDYTAATHGLSALPGVRVYRPRMLAPALAHSV